MPVTALRKELLGLVLEGQMEIVPWTVDQYHWAIQNGVVPEDRGTELLDGFIVRKSCAPTAGEAGMTIGDRHRLALQELNDLGPQFKPFGCFLQKDDPVALPLGHEPEPDAAVVRGKPKDYADGPPGPGNILCVVEVSDSSLLRDTTVKLRVYASAGIPTYIVIDLQHDLVLIYRDPNPVDGTYLPPVTLRRGDTLAVPAGGANHVDVPVAELL